jgi:hypothetical protein
MRKSIAFKDLDLNNLRESHDPGAANALHTGGSSSHVSTVSDSESNSSIRYIARVWSNLPPHVREAILTLIESAHPCR